jgi:hypothetical protein
MISRSPVREGRWEEAPNRDVTIEACRLQPRCRGRRALLFATGYQDMRVSESRCAMMHNNAT